jgi:hypothetical protein
VNGYNGASSYDLRPNNDTGSNYGYQKLQAANTSVGSERGTTQNVLLYAGGGECNALNELSMSECIIYVKSGFVRTGINEVTHEISGTTVTLLQYMGLVWNNTSDEINSLVIIAAQANGLGIGTEIVLERLNL